MKQPNYTVFLAERCLTNQTTWLAEQAKATLLCTYGAFCKQN